MAVLFKWLKQKLLSEAVGVISFSGEKYLYFHDTFFSVSSSLLKANKSFEILSKVIIYH